MSDPTIEEMRLAVLEDYSNLPAKAVPKPDTSPIIQMSEFCIAVDEGGMDDPSVKAAVASVRKSMDEASAEYDGWSEGKREGADVGLRRTIPTAALESEDEAFEQWFKDDAPLNTNKSSALEGWNARARLDAERGK